MRLFAVWFIFVSVFAFDDSECVFFILFTTLENGEEGVVVKLCVKFQSLQRQWHQELPGKPSWCLLLHLSLSIMHVSTFEVLQKDLIQTKTIFAVAITNIVIIISYYLASSQNLVIPSP